MEKSLHKRRDFIKLASMGTVFSATPFPGLFYEFLEDDGKKNGEISKVHLLFKTHLDIGFTDYAADVLVKYFDHFLPVALGLAKDSRLENHKQRFIWSTGAWLIYEYLERSGPENRKKMEQAIEAGDVVWHGLPFTMHSELMSSSMLQAGMRLAKVLDERFGKKTIAAKMTDVPGHTRSIVHVLQQEGMEMLHIGVNPASPVPEVPEMFTWQTKDGSEIMVMYHGSYGGIMILPDQKTAVSIVFTGDNHGPQSQKEISEIYKILKRRFPNADIQASDFNQVAIDLGKHKGHLPVVSSEIGDTWIHGAGSDPLKIAQFRELVRFREELLGSGELIAGSAEDMSFAIPLAMVAEHTWGMDIKTYLKSWDIYSQEKFEASRNTVPFRRVEKSWQEKRNYIRDAVDALSPDLSGRADEKLNSLVPVRNSLSGLDSLNLDEGLDTEFFVVKFDRKSGAIVSLIQKESGRDWADHRHSSGLFTYQTFDHNDYTRFLDQYLRTLTEWALYDFGKPGLENANPENNTWQPHVKTSVKSENKEGIRIYLESEITGKDGKPPYGCPAQIRLEVFFPANVQEIWINLLWFNKKATRLPEALWFSFIPKLRENETWIMDKSGHEVDPCDVVRNGGRKLHAVQKGVRAGEDNGRIIIESVDAPVVAPGERNLLNFDNALPLPGDGMHFCLCNNVWGTNFTMWFEDDMQFRFKLRFET
jgi:hypothetical protein